MNTKSNEVKITVETGHSAAQIKSAKLALSGIVTNGGKLIQFFRDAYTFNKLNAKSETGDFSKVNSACYAELQVSEKTDAKGYNVAKVQASKAKAEIKPSDAKKAKKATKKPAKEVIVTTPAEIQEEAFQALNPVDLFANVISRMKAEKKMDKAEIEKAFNSALVRCFKVSK